MTEIPEDVAQKLVNAITNHLDLFHRATTESAKLHVALDLIEADQHSWSTRPCQTCQQITALINRPFGCVAYKQRKEGGA